MDRCFICIKKKLRLTCIFNREPSIEGWKKQIYSIIRNKGMLQKMEIRGERLQEREIERAEIQNGVLNRGEGYNYNRLNNNFSFVCLRINTTLQSFFLAVNTALGWMGINNALEDKPKLSLSNS